MIPVYEPSLGKEELQNTIEAVRSGWVSSKGKFIPEFEESFAKYCGAKYGVSCSNGTAALHLALKALGIKEGDEVLVPTLTFVSTANVVLFAGAKPVFVDSDPECWCMDPKRMEQAITKHTKAVIPVHLYGHPCEMEEIMRIARKNSLHVVEDAAESHGAECNGQKVGSFGEVGCFSFYGNKIITTGEGGMCVTKNEELAGTMKILRDHGMNPKKKYWHDRLGYNYRITNLQAALGVAQLKKLDALIQKKRQIAEWYRRELQDLERKSFIKCQSEMHWAKNIYWMYSILIKEGFPIVRDSLIARLEGQGIETRPFFYPVHTFPFYYKGESFPVAEKLSKEGMNLPSSANLSEKQVNTVVKEIASIAKTLG